MSSVPEKLFHHREGTLEGRARLGQLALLIVDEGAVKRARQTPTFDERAIYKRVDVICGGFPRIPLRRIFLLLFRQDAAAQNLINLDAFVVEKPFGGAFNGRVVHLAIALLRKVEPSSYQRGDMRGGVAASEPSPTSVGILTRRQRVDASFNHAIHLFRIKDGVLLRRAFPLPSASRRVSEFLRVQVRPLRPDRLKIKTKIAERLTRDRRWKEPIQRLLNAPVRIVREIRNRVKNRAREGRRISQRQGRGIFATLRRNVDRRRDFSNEILVLARLARSHSGEGDLFVDSVFVNRQRFLDRVRLSRRERLHEEIDLSRLRRFDAPVDALGAVDRNVDLHFLRIEKFQRAFLPFVLGEGEGDGRALVGIGVIMNDGGKNRFVAARQESGLLHPDDHVFRRDERGFSGTDAQSRGDSPRVDVPRREILWDVDLDFDRAVVVGGQVGGPVCKVGKIRTNDRFGKLLGRRRGGGDFSYLLRFKARAVVHIRPIRHHE